MAKNTWSSAFRKIDVDQFNEDNFREDDAEQAGPPGPDEAVVQGLLAQYPLQIYLLTFVHCRLPRLLLINQSLVCDCIRFFK